MMKDFRVVIIEDEKPAARLLARRLDRFGFTDITLLHSVAQGKSWLASNPEPDLIFMDIQLSDGLSFEILEEHPISSKLIFTTAYNEFALKAFKHNSIDYLLKPIVDEELEFAIQKFQKNHQINTNLDVQQLRSILLGEEHKYKARFNVRVGQQIKIISVNDIACVYSENKGTYLFSKQGDCYLLDYSLDRMEELLDPKLFFRINRGHIIGLESISSIAIHSNSRLKVVIKDFQSDACIVSRERVVEFKNWLE